MVYYGFWYSPKMDALMAFIREVQKPVTGEVTLGLYKGNIEIQSRTSPNSLYDEEIATMEGGGTYNQDDAEGFLRIMGLPSRVQGQGPPAEVLRSASKSPMYLLENPVLQRELLSNLRSGQVVLAPLRVRGAARGCGLFGVAGGSDARPDAESRGVQAAGQYVLSWASICWRR